MTMTVRIAAAAVALTVAASTGAAERALAPLPFDRIMRYDELTTLLKQWEAARPALVDLTSIGTTPKGRAIWFLTLTNEATGPASEKPAILVDGNQHATEWAGGVAALHVASRLLSGYGTDRRITELLDTRAVYVLPRMSPDGVEAALAENRFIRSVDRPYPNPFPQPGLHPRDMDGDGRTVFMRFRDRNGPFKVHPDEPRLLVARRPDETGGEYWRVVREGLIERYDGVTIAEAPPLEGLDFGQNFPSDRRSTPESGQAGAYPTSVPEVAAYVAAIAERPNIVAHVSCHTFGGLVLTPPVNLQEPIPEADRLAYGGFTEEATALTGYRALSYLDLRATDKESYIPTPFGWMYDRRGIYSFITEFWDPWRAAGISLEGTLPSAWLSGFHPVEDEQKFLRWNDSQVGGRCFVPWRRFEHPQLGEVEIGGWDVIGCFYNVPFDLLEKEIAPHSEWLVFLGLATPRLEIRSLTADSISPGTWRVRLVVENTGWLPTNGSQRAIERQAVGETTAELALPAGARLASGGLRRSLGQLAGRSEQRSIATWWGYVPGTPDRAFADWIVTAKAGAKVSVTVRHERAGTARAEVVLEEGK